jgi:hypothetical protein
LRYWAALAAVKYASKSIRIGGSVVLATGVAGQRPHKGWVVAASVWGTIEALTRALAVELAPIRVNAVSPGVVRTNLWQNMTVVEREDMYGSVGKSLPVGRVGEPHDIAEALSVFDAGGIRHWADPGGRWRNGPGLIAGNMNRKVEGIGMKFRGSVISPYRRVHPGECMLAVSKWKGEHSYENRQFTKDRNAQYPQLPERSSGSWRTVRRAYRKRFADVDVAATMQTMVAEPYVYSVAVMRGSFGGEGIRGFYSGHFINQIPKDAKVTPISRTVGRDQVVAELVLSFTHDTQWDYLLPGIPPTGKRVEIPHVVVMKFENEKSRTSTSGGTRHQCSSK